LPISFWNGWKAIRSRSWPQRTQRTVVMRGR
jgi:hypothetical protein